MAAENIKVEAMYVFYGENVAQVQKIVCHADSADTPLANKFFYLYLPDGTKHYFWFNVATAGVDPAPAGATGHVVAIAANASAATVAAALELVIDAVVGFDSTVSGNEIEVTNTTMGYADPAMDGLDADATLFGLQILVQGDSELQLGCVNGDIEVSFEETFAEVKCHDTGTTPVAILKTGVSNVGVSMSLLETTKSKLRVLFAKTGGAFTPEGGTEVFGMGTFKNFENMFKYASKLRLHPVRLLPGDLSEDWTFHKAIPKLQGITFSGENPLEFPLEFQVLPDETKNARVNYFSIGDGSQNLA